MCGGRLTPRPSSHSFIRNPDASCLDSLTIDGGGTAADRHPRSDDRQVDVLADEDEDVEEGEQDGHGQVGEDGADAEVRVGGGIAVAEDVQRPREGRVEDEVRFRWRRLRGQMDELGLREEEGRRSQAQDGYDAMHGETLPGRREMHVIHIVYVRFVCYRQTDLSTCLCYVFYYVVRSLTWNVQHANPIHYMELGTIRIRDFTFLSTPPCGMRHI